MKLSQYPFSHGEPDEMYCICGSTLATHLRSALAIISGLLSQRMCPGMAWISMASAKASITPGLLDATSHLQRQADSRVLVDQRQDA